MSFEHEQTTTTTATPARIWELWSDVGSWHCWDPAVERVAMEGHFAEGAGGTVSLANGIEAPFLLEIVEPGTRYLDRLTVGDLLIRVDHEVAQADGRTQITVRTTIEGIGAEEIGPMAVEDTPRALAALVALAEDAAAIG